MVEANLSSIASSDRIHHLSLLNWPWPADFSEFNSPPAASSISTSGYHFKACPHFHTRFITTSKFAATPAPLPSSSPKSLAVYGHDWGCFFAPPVPTPALSAPSTAYLYRHCLAGDAVAMTRSFAIWPPGSKSLRLVSRPQTARKRSLSAAHPREGRYRRWPF